MMTRCEPITTSIVVAYVAHKVLDKMDKKLEEGVDKRTQLESLLFKIQNEKDADTLKGMNMAYHELCAKYEIYDAEPVEHKKRACFCSPFDYLPLPFKS